LVLGEACAKHCEEILLFNNCELATLGGPERLLCPHPLAQNKMMPLGDTHHR